MKKENRIKKNDDFKNIIFKHNLLKCDNIFIFYLFKNSNKIEKVRVGITVSSKIKSAVVRNRIKRQLRSIVDSVIDFDKMHNIDFVFLAKEPIINFQKTLEIIKKNIDFIKIKFIDFFKKENN